MEKLGREPAPIKDADATGGGLAYYTTALVSWLLVI